MQPEYVAYRDELIEDMLSRYRQPRETLSIPYLLKGQCMPWSDKFVQKFPHLTKVRGFYNGAEHAWCVEEDGTIVDPTLWQFTGVGADDSDPSAYRVWNPETDEVYLGRCMNCGDSIYGLAAKGHQSVCSESCGDSLTGYYNGLIGASRGGF